jgi:O-antigen ligase
VKTVVERAAWALLCLFVFTIPWEKSVWVPGIGTFARLLGIVAFGAGVAAAVVRRAPRRPNLALALAGVFMAWSGATYFWSLDRAATLARAVTLAELWVMFWLIWESCRGAARQRQLMAAYLAGAVAASAMAFARYAAHLQTSYRRYAAAGFDPNDFGLVLALAVPMALYLSLTARGAWCWLARGAALAAILAIFLTASRTALVATLVGFVFAAWTWRRARPAQRVSSVALLAVVLFGMMPAAPAPQRNRLATLPGELQGGTLHGRTHIWKCGLKAFKARALAGVGSGAYPAAVQPWLGRPPVAAFRYVAHNTFLSVLVETGLIGFGVYALLLGVLAAFVWAMPPPERALWAVLLAAWAAGVFTLTWEQYKPTWLIMALITTEWTRAYWRAGEAS